MSSAASKCKRVLFPRSGRPDDRDHLAALDRKIDAVERRDFLAAGMENLAKVFGAQNFARARRPRSKGRRLDCYSRARLRLHHLLYLSHTLDAELAVPVCPFFACS